MTFSQLLVWGEGEIPKWRVVSVTPEMVTLTMRDGGIVKLNRRVRISVPSLTEFHEEIGTNNDFKWVLGQHVEIFSRLDGRYATINRLTGDAAIVVIDGESCETSLRWSWLTPDFVIEEWL